jgi:hypothetical protein
MCRLPRGAHAGEPKVLDFDELAPIVERRRVDEDLFVHSLEARRDPPFDQPNKIGDREPFDPGKNLDGNPFRRARRDSGSHVEAAKIETSFQHNRGSQRFAENVDLWLHTAQPRQFLEIINAGIFRLLGLSRLAVGSARRARLCHSLADAQPRNNLVQSVLAQIAQRQTLIVQNIIEGTSPLSGEIVDPQSVE